MHLTYEKWGLIDMSRVVEAGVINHQSLTSLFHHIPVTENREIEIKDSIPFLTSKYGKRVLLEM